MLSVEAVQLKSISEEENGFAERLLGIDGAVVSFVAAGVAGAVGSALFFWPAARGLHAAAAPGQGFVGYSGAF